MPRIRYRIMPHLHIYTRRHISLHIFAFLLVLFYIYICSTDICMMYDWLDLFFHRIVASVQYYANDATLAGTTELTGREKTDSLIR